MDELFVILQPPILFNDWAATVKSYGVDKFILLISIPTVTLGFMTGLIGTAAMRLPFFTLLWRTIAISVLIGASVPLGGMTRNVWKLMYEAGNGISTKALNSALNKSGTFGTMLGVIAMAATAGKMVGNGAMKAKNLKDLSKSAVTNGKDLLRWASLLNQILAPFWLIYLLVVVISGLTVYIGTLLLPLLLALCMFQSLGGNSWISAFVRGMIAAIAMMVFLPLVFTFALKFGWEAPMNYVNKGLQVKVDEMVTTMNDIGRQEEAIVKAIMSLGTDTASSIEAVKATAGGGLVSNGLKMAGIVIEVIGMFIVGCFAIIVGLVIGGTLLFQTDKLIGSTLGGAAMAAAKTTVRTPRSQRPQQPARAA
jgi:hypothetical protein